jgi:hypothetical protein
VAPNFYGVTVFLMPRETRATMKTLLTVTVVIEAGAGLALLGVPSVTASLLLGTPLDSAVAVSLARVGGAAILTLALVCWLARRDADSLASRGLIVAMLFYNFAVAAVLAFASLSEGLHGVLLWPAVAFHVGMGAWCIASLLSARRA